VRCRAVSPRHVAGVSGRSGSPMQAAVLRSRTQPRRKARCGGSRCSANSFIVMTLGSGGSNGRRRAVWAFCGKGRVARQGVRKNLSGNKYCDRTLTTLGVGSVSSGPLCAGRAGSVSFVGRSSILEFAGASPHSGLASVLVMVHRLFDCHGNGSHVHNALLNFEFSI
jgi:hypothetical protein